MVGASPNNGTATYLFREIANSPFRVVFIPIQSDPAGQQRWSVPAGDRKDHLNKTTPQNPIDNENGQGTGSRIEFDPNNKLDPAKHPRDPIDAAAHEAGSHAWHNMKGTHSPDHDVEEGRAREFQIRVHKALQKMKKKGEE